MKLHPVHLLLPLLLCACQQEPVTYTWAEARDYLETPRSMSRGVDYLGSDARFHYFEHKLEMARDVRFRIPVAEEIYAPCETMPYRSWLPERRDAYTELLGLSLTIDPDSSCKLNGTRYATPAEIPAALWPKVGRVHFNDKRWPTITRLKHELQPYLRNSPEVRFTHATSGLPPHLLQQGEHAAPGTLRIESLEALIKNQQP